MNAINQYLTDLIGFQTYLGIQKSEQVDLAYKYILSHIPKTYTHQIIDKDGDKSLIIKNPRAQSNSKRLLLQAHIDVVPGLADQFNAQMKDEKIIGRGASDMKFAIATYMQILNDLANTNPNLEVWITSDEEIGGFNGVQYLLQQDSKFTLCYLPDGTNDYSLVTNAKGILHITICSTGKKAHGSKPWLGKNAITNLIDFYSEFSSNKLFTSTDKRHWHNTLNLGKISGGDALNVVPDQSKVGIDIRYIDKDNHRKIINLLNALTQKYHLSYTIGIQGNAYSLHKDDPHTRLFEETLQSHAIPYKTSVDHGSSDARFFAEKNIPTIMFKPICGGDHSENEWIDAKSLFQFYKLTKKYIEAMYK